MNIVDQYRLSQLRRGVAIQRFICGEVDVAKFAADLARLGYSRSEIEAEIRDAVEDGGAAICRLATKLLMPPHQFDCGREPARRAVFDVPAIPVLPGDNSNSGQPVFVHLGESAGTRRETAAPISGGHVRSADHITFAAAGDGGQWNSASQKRVAAIANNPTEPGVAT